jgi:hypothetical protein
MSPEEIHLNLTNLQKDLTTEIKTKTVVEKDLKTVSEALKKKNAFALREAIENLRKSSAKVGPPVEGLEQLLIPLTNLQNEMQRNAVFGFNRDIRQLFESQGISLKMSDDRLFAEFLSIEINKAAGTANIKFGHDNLNEKPLSLDPERVFSAYKNAEKILIERKTDYPKLLELLYKACQRVVSPTGKIQEARANIVDCYLELVWLKQSDSFRRNPSKNAFVDYPRPFFAYDLQQLRKQNLLSFNNHRLQLGTATIDATENRLRSMWIPETSETGRYYMDIYWIPER